EKPQNRKMIETELVPPSSRPHVLNRVLEAVSAGRQVYMICPLVEKSSLVAGASAVELYEHLRTHEFKSLRVGLLHGKLQPAVKEEIMASFAAGKIDVLVCTTVIEVGVDVPNATIMVIESPERFGLAQLHQLRGRVGRSDLQSHCYVMLSEAKKPTRRLLAFAQSQDGFKLSEYDLELRGPGAIYGIAQHGALDLSFTK